jgi:hypothetical protein
MKKALFLCASFFLFAVTMSAQTETPAPTKTETVVPSKAVMTFEDGNADTTLDYGTIEHNGDPLRVVKFTNTGTEPLIIKNARGSCGCTVPSWPKEPILPGETNQIEIRYATNRVGKINKKVTITTNEDKQHIINVVGKVLPKEEEKSVPESKPSVIGGGGE